MLVVVEGIKKGGGTTPDKIIEGLNKVSGLQGTTGVITICRKPTSPLVIHGDVPSMDRVYLKPLALTCPP